MSNTKTEAQRLADRTTPYHGPHAQAMARELLRLETENQQLKTSLALVQQHHATAWNRGHQAGIRAGESAVKQATDAVKADAWGNTQLTNALMQAEAERDQLRAQLAKAVAEVRKPLTEVEMEKGREQLFSTNNPYCPCDRKTFKKVAEWVERHHGIAAAIRARSNT